MAISLPVMPIGLAVAPVGVPVPPIGIEVPLSDSILLIDGLVAEGRSPGSRVVGVASPRCGVVAQVCSELASPRRPLTFLCRCRGFGHALAVSVGHASPHFRRPLFDDPVPLVGDVVAYASHAIAFLGETVTLVGDPLTLVDATLALFGFRSHRASSARRERGSGQS